MVRQSLLLTPLVVVLVIASAVTYAEDSDTAPGDAPQLRDRLLLEQGKLTDTYRRFKSELLKLAELSRKEDPERAALLEKAVAESGKRGIHDQLGEILDLLNTNLLRDLDEVSSRQSEVEQDLQRLLKLLLTENRADQKRSERQRIKKYIQEINRAIKRQKEISSRGQRGGDTERLGKRQGRLADKIGDLADTIKENEESQAGEGDEEGKSSDGKQEEGEQGDGEQKSGNQKDGESADGKSSEGKSSEGKSSDGKSDKSAEGKDGKNKDGKNKDGESKDGEKSDDAGKGDSESKESEQGEGQEEGKSAKGEPSEGQPSQGQPSQGQPSQGQPSQSQPSQSQPSDSPESEPFPARERVEAAAEKMREAQEKLEEAKRGEAKRPQEDALAHLEKAKRELEEILRQMREEEMEKTLALLEGRFRKMLEMQQVVFDATVGLNKKPKKERDRADEIEADRLARKEVKIIGEIDKAMVLLREDGTSVALPEAVMQLREDMEMVAERLTDAKVGKLTQDVESDIIEALKEIIAALEKARKDLKDGAPPPPPGPPSGEPGEPPLVDELAELKMIRALQMRVNRRTEQYKEMIDTGEVEADWMAPTIRRLADREQRIHRVTRDIVLGKNR